MKKIYFNTTGVNGNELLKALNDCEKQDDRVLEIFKKMNRMISPTQLEEIYYEFTGMIIPRSSIARSLNTLTKKGYLVKTENFRLSKYKKREYFWKINTQVK